MLPPSEEIRRRSEERKRDHEEWLKANPGGCIRGETDSLYEDRWVPPFKGKGCELWGSILPVWLEAWRKEIDDPDSLRTAEDIDLFHVLHYLGPFGHEGSKKDTVTITLYKDFRTDEEEICRIDGLDGFFVLRRIDIPDGFPHEYGKPENEEIEEELHNRAIKNWVKDHPTKQWYVPKIGNPIDLVRMQEVIEKRKKEGAVVPK